MFAAAMNIYTTTWNDALSYSTPDLSGEKEGRISLFFKAIRGCSDDKLYEYLKKSSKEDIIDTIIVEVAKVKEKSVKRFLLGYFLIIHRYFIKFIC